jgi:hypothetical protein
LDKGVSQFDGLFEATSFVGFENFLGCIARLLGAKGCRGEKGESQRKNLGGEEEEFFHPSKNPKASVGFLPAELLRYGHISLANLGALWG